MLRLPLSEPWISYPWNGKLPWRMAEFFLFSSSEGISPLAVQQTQEDEQRYIIGPMFGPHQYTGRRKVTIPYPRAGLGQQFASELPVS